METFGENIGNLINMSSKLEKYDRLYEQIKAYVGSTDDIWARMATMEAVLHHKMQAFF